jgi:hypothetical protein
MNDDSTTSARMIATRELLAEQVRASSRNTRPTRRKRHTFLASIAAFALAGALTGGAVSTVAAVAGNNSEPSAAQNAAYGFVGSHGRLLGAPMTITDTTPTILDFGSAPAGATGLVIALDCYAANNIVATVHTKGDMSSGECSGVGATEVTVTGPAKQKITVTPAKASKYTVWASWVKEKPLPGQSPQQKAALADGQVTHDEYVAAFNRYSGCLTAAGYPLGPVPTDTPYISYAVIGGAVDSGADASCYAAEFNGIDEAWQLHANDVIDSCLAARGIALPQQATQQDALDLLTSHQLTFAGCENDPAK